MTSNLFIHMAEESVIEFCDGDVLKDRYQILKQSGSRDSNGRIYYCIDLWNQEPCVLKAHSVQLTKEADSRVVQSFREELYKMTVLLPHRNVVTFYRIEVIQNIYFLVTEWLPHSLRQYLMMMRQQERSLSAEEILSIGLSVCEGMQHCIRYLSTEKNPFVHGDLKPENILMSKDGRAKLTDFGGGYTEGYASAEQLDKKAVDTRSDIYSLGIILEELCQYCIEEEPAVKKIRELAGKCCMECPEDRIQSFGILEQELRGIYFDIAGHMPELPEENVNDAGRLKVSQFSNLALIGEPVKVYPALVELMRSETDEDVLAEGFYCAANILCMRGAYQEALPLYRLAADFDHERHSMIQTGMAYAYLNLSEWKEAHDCAAHALKIHMFDYDAIKIAIDSLFMLGETKGLRHVYTALQLLYEKRPDSAQVLKYIGYIHYLQKDFRQACLFFEKYVEQRKNDWEVYYFYGTSLYMEFDTTKAIECLQTAVEMMESKKEEEMSRTKLLYLAMSYYYLNDDDNSIWYLEQFEERYGMPEQIIALEIMHYDDMIIMEQYGPKLSEVTNRFLESEKIYWVSPQFYINIIAEFEEMRGEWGRKTRDASVSSAVRYMNRKVCCHEGIAYMRFNKYDQAAEMFDEALKWDRSLPEAWFNKAECLIQMDQYYDAISCYLEAAKYQKNPERSYDIHRRMEETKQYFRSTIECQQELIKRMLEEAKQWNGSPVQLQMQTVGKEDLFTDEFSELFREYAETRIRQLQMKTASFQFMGIPYPALSEFVQQCVYCVGVMQQIQGPLKDIFTETALKVYDLLIEQAHRSGGVCFNALPMMYSFRGMGFLYRLQGDKTANMELAAADFQSCIAELKRREISDDSMLAELYDNLGNAWLMKEKGDVGQNLETAATYYGKALSFVSEETNMTQWAFIQYNLGVCEYKRHHYAEAMTALQNCLKYITVRTNLELYAKANENIANMGALALSEAVHFVETFEEIFLAYQNALIYYTKYNFPKEYANILLRIAVIMKQRYERLHDGSWMLMRQYYQMIPYADLQGEQAEEVYHNIRMDVERLAPIVL